MPMALSTDHRATASRLPLIACGYELSAVKGVSQLCAKKPAVTVLHKLGQGNLYLCKRHATGERIQAALAQGYTVRGV